MKEVLLVSIPIVNWLMVIQSDSNRFKIKMLTTTNAFDSKKFISKLNVFMQGC